MTTDLLPWLREVLDEHKLDEVDFKCSCGEPEDATYDFVEDFTAHIAEVLNTRLAGIVEDHFGMKKPAARVALAALSGGSE